ncbi:PGC-1 and ERR-induced regulator in muscle protein 1 [Sardina pilchardus]|uniref:PGC-1 and ERR-induced regulator in muscle protein 1 n=1 Tax=Sardina pilchardus TaxID=27697 RepID=UPI002E141726
MSHSSVMDDFEYSVHISERDWDCFFQECEECDLLPPVLAGLEDSGMSDIDDLGCHLSHRTSRTGRDITRPDPDVIDGPPDCEGSPVEMYLDTYGLRSPEYILSGSEDDFHIESVNRFFEQLRNVTTAEQSPRNHQTAKGNVTRTQENLCNSGIDDDEYPPISQLSNGPLGVKKDQDAFGTNDVKPKRKTDPSHLVNCTGIQSNAAATDWYTRSMELAIGEEEQPANPQKSRVWKEYDRGDASHNNLTMETKVQPVELGSSDTATALSSDLASCSSGMDGMRGDDMYGQPVFRREPQPGQGLSPCSTLRRKKRRKKRLSIEPVEPGHSIDGQFHGNHSESDEGIHARKAEVDREARLSGDFGTVKMADKCRLSLHPVIDSFSDHLPGQANSRTGRDSIPVPRELSAAGNQADGIDLPETHTGACHSQTSKKMEPRRRSTDMSNARCYEKPLSPVQLVLENSCNSAERPMSANVSEQMKIPTLPVNNSVSTQEESEGDKVTGNLQQNSSEPLYTHKSDHVPVSHTPLETLGSSTENGLKIVHSPVEAQRKIDLPLSLNGILKAGGENSYSPAPLTQINNSALELGKVLPPYSAMSAISQNGIGSKHAHNTDDLKKIYDSFSDFGLRRNEILNQLGSTCDRGNSLDAPKPSTDVTAISDGYSIKNANTLGCVQPRQKVPHQPTNKDSTTRSDTVSQMMPLDVEGLQAQTSLLDNNNKPGAPPAHLNDPTTAECPAALGKTTSDKQMQMKEESAEKSDLRPDNTRSKQIITYPAETDPKVPAPRDGQLSKGTRAEEHGMPQKYGDDQRKRSYQPETKTDSHVRSHDNLLGELSKVSRTDRKAVVYPCTNALSNTDSDIHSNMTIATKPANEAGNSEIQRCPANSNAVVKETCKAVSVKPTLNREVSRPETDEDRNTHPTPLPEEESEAAVSEKKDIEAATNEPSPVFAMSSFWNEMEKLTINDILRLRLVNQAQHPSILAPTDDDGSFAEASHARDSGYFTHVDDSRPDRSSGDMSTMSDFDEDPSSSLQEVPKEGEDEASAKRCDIMWVNDDPDSVLTTAEADDVVVLSTETAIPQSRFAEQQYFRKMYKNISVQNLRALENQPLRQILRNASMQSLRSLDGDEDPPDPFYHINTSAHFSDDESVAEGHGFSLSEMIEYLFCDDDTKSTASETENLISYNIDGTSVPENYDHFFSEFEAANLFLPTSEGFAGSYSDEKVPIFCSRSGAQTLQFPELYDHFFPDSPTQSDEDEEERELSPPIRVVSRYHSKVAALPNCTPTVTSASDSRNTGFWTSPLSLRRVRRTSLALPSYQPYSWLLAPADNAKKTSIRTIQPINVMGYEDQGSFPDPLLCDLESRIFRKLAEQKMRFPEVQTADPRIDAPLVPLRQSDMCLVCIAFASWVLKSASPQGADTWKAVLLANVSALSAIRYLRRYVRDEAAGAKPLRQIQS